MEIKLFNTLTHKKEEFNPINENEVRMYSCGPTVYSYAHIGNMRTYIFSDLLKRILEYNGLKVKHCMNITDVGHLTSDADTGEDKMVKAAREQQKDPYEIAEYYTKIFINDLEKLNIKMPSILTKATDNIEEMKTMVNEIIKNGYGYETSKGIYFDISKLEKYPQLSNNVIEGQELGARIEIDNEKRNPADFAIWIKAPKEHIMKWESDYGLAYPGWHIECSAMSKRFLGDHFDIHTGGVDHISIHHENEIAQSIGANGKNPANYWMHGEFLLVDNQKMSKSLKNIYTISDLDQKGIEPLAFKLFTYNSSYRNKLNFNFESAKAAQVALNRLRNGYIAHLKSNLKIEEIELNNLRKRFMDSINDDLNITEALSIVFEIAKKEEKSLDYAKLLLEFDKVLALDLENSEKYLESEVEVPEEINILIEKRKLAKLEKNYKLADEIREEIKEKGYLIEDTKDGVKIKRVGE